MQKIKNYSIPQMDVSIINFVEYSLKFNLLLVNKVILYKLYLIKIVSLLGISRIRDQGGHIVRLLQYMKI